MQFTNLETFLEETQQRLAQAFEDAEPLLTRALQASGGEFPLSIKEINSVRVLLDKSELSVVELVDQILKDPLLSLRLVSLVNYPAYARGRPTQNVTSAVNQLGYLKIADVLKDFSSEKDYGNLFLGRGIAYDVFCQAIAASILSVKLVNLVAPKRRIAEEAQLISILFSAPMISLSYYRPNIYSALRLESAKSGVDFDRCFKKICKSQIFEVAQKISENMSLPKYFSRILGMLAISPWNRRVWTTEEQEMRPLVSCVYLANVLTEEIFRYADGAAFRSLLKDLASKLDFSIESINEVLAELPTSLEESLSAIGLKKTSFPSYVKELASKGETIGSTKNQTAASGKMDLKIYLGEIKACFRSQREDHEISRIPQVIHSTFLALTKSLGFTRAVFLVPNAAAGVLKIAFKTGLPHPGMETFQSSFTSKNKDYLPDIKAWNEGKAVFTGDPLFPDDWPFAAFPAMSGGKPIGIFYADRASNDSDAPLGTDEQLAVIALAEVWQDVPESM